MKIALEWGIQHILVVPMFLSLREGERGRLCCLSTTVSAIHSTFYGPFVISWRIGGPFSIEASNMNSVKCVETAGPQSVAYA